MACAAQGQGGVPKEAHPVEEAGEVDVHHVARGRVDQDVLAVAVAQAHDVPDLRARQNRKRSPA